jgi:hypothetical protein
MEEPTTSPAPEPVPARVEITLKFTSMPEPMPGPNGWKRFALVADGRTYQATVRPKIWNKLSEGAQTWQQWTAVCRGKLGAPIADGFELVDASLEVFERKEKAPKEATPNP